jgi:hypothetical protein
VSGWVDLRKNNLAALQKLRDVFSRHREYLPVPYEVYDSLGGKLFFFFSQYRAMFFFFWELEESV